MKIDTVDLRKKWEMLSYEGKEKKIIFLHHTAGYDAKSAEDWLYKSSLKNFRENKSCVGVNYYIDKTGIIYYAIDESKWAWHSGLGNLELESRTISIELDNLGFMRKEDGCLFDLYNNRWVIDKEEGNLIKAYFGRYNFEFIELETFWRGFNIYHKYSDEQIASLIKLLTEIFNRHKIERRIHKNFLPEQATLKSDIYKNFSGIVNHSQFIGQKTNSDNYYDKLKSYVKWDLSIIFPVERMKTALGLQEI